MAFYCPDIKRYDVMDRLKHFGGVFHSYDFVEEGLCTMESINRTEARLSRSDRTHEPFTNA